ncbi:MAG: hypothetical protein EKK41_17915 [Hyphomicrobiales bacterium]|nr:MAG: hypothetical protein EKK41_17915 [Hyphomicrobiales bacterium]
MIAHVAQAGEDRGRVVLHVCSPQPHALALLAAVKIAQAFQSEIESLFVEDVQLFDCAAFGFVREVSLSGRSSSKLSADSVAQSLKLAAQGARRELERLARSVDVPLRTRVVRDDPMQALRLACSEVGPWNVVALSEPFTGGFTPMLRTMFDAIEGTTGLILVGPRARRITGPIVIALEDMGRLPDLLRAGERLAALDDVGIVVLLVAPDAQRLHDMEMSARMALAGREKLRIDHAIVSREAPAVAAEALRRQAGGFVICQFGGAVVPDEGDLSPLAASLECPLLLVR